MVSYFLVFYVSNGFVLMFAHLSAAVTSLNLLRLASVGKNLPLKVAPRAQAWWGAVSLVPGRAQWCSLHASPSAEVNVSKDCEGFLWPILWRSCSWWWYAGSQSSSGAGPGFRHMQNYHSTWVLGHRHTLLWQWHWFLMCQPVQIPCRHLHSDSDRRVKVRWHSIGRGPGITECSNSLGLGGRLQ